MNTTTPSVTATPSGHHTGLSSRPMRRLAGIATLALCAASLGLTGCAGMSRQARDASIGAAAGAVAGQVITGTTAGAAVGAAVGGLIGNENGKK